VANLVSCTLSISELAHAEKSRTQSFTYPAYLIRREPKRLRLKKYNSLTPNPVFVKYFNKINQ